MSKKMKTIGKMVVACCFCLASMHCASERRFANRPLIIEENDTRTIAKPEAKNISLYEDAIDNIFIQEIDELANLPWHVRKLSNNPRQAMNLNVLGEVANSSWFTNRHAKHPLSLSELKRGPNSGTPPAQDGPLTIMGAKLEGVTPGFRIQDRKGDIYFVKFDIKGYPEMQTAAEVITTKFVYAAGYNTPENYLSNLDPKQLQIAENVTVKNRWGREVPMTLQFVEKILDKAHRNANGTYRIVASKLLEGEPLGPFSYHGRRNDDPNDRIPHQHRRELRGYKVLAAWLNNSDTKANNTLDMYVTENGRRFVRHYLIDFGTSLGSGGYGAAGTSRGHRGAFDLGKMLLKIFSLGLWVEPWEKQPGLISPAVGYFESKLFNPGNYAFIIPNPAFQRGTSLDVFWGAHLVMSFTDEQIRAIVETGQYSNPEDEEYVIKTLIERRDKTGRYWYRQVNPLDDFRVIETTDGHYAIQFTDLAVEAGFEAASETIYRYKAIAQNGELSDYFFVAGKPVLELDAKMVEMIDHRQQTAKSGGSENIIALRIETKRGKRVSWSTYVEVYFHYSINNGRVPQIIAVER
ncbi:MAG: hypothetical protein ACE5HS_09265 [bacterium]